MDYDTPDGSHFSLREVWRNIEPGNEDWPEFVYTSISANVDGKAYFGRLDERADDVDEVDVLSCLQPVPPTAVCPTFKEGLTCAPAFDPDEHYLKAPSFTWDDCQPGITFVADCVMNEVTILEQIKQEHHANIVAYHGCVVAEGRITHICLEKCQSNIVDFLESNRDTADLSKLIADICAGVAFLHSLGLAHNDINPENICVRQGRAVIVDFDSCMPFGQKLMKGVSVAHSHGGSPVSAAENDICGIEDVKDYLTGVMRNSPPSRSAAGPD